MNNPAISESEKQGGFKKKLLRNIFVAGGYNYLSQILVFLSSIITSRLLSPESFGTVGLITAFTGFILVFSDGGISYALIRSEYGRLFQRILTNVSWLLGIVLCGITVLLAWPIAKFYNNPALTLPTIILGFNFIIRSISLTSGAVLSKQLQFGYIGKVTLICNSLAALTTIILAWFGFGFWSLIYPQLIISVLTAIFYERKVGFGFKIFPWSHIVVCFKHTKRLLGSILGFNAINYWARNSDNIIVGKYYGAADLGIYNRAYSLLTLPVVLISGIFNNVLFPSLKELKLKGGDTEKEFFFVLKLVSFITMPPVILLLVAPQELVLLLWGKNWVSVAELLPYFGLLIFTQNLISSITPVLILNGKEKSFFIMGTVNAVILVTAILIGALYSVVGVARFYSLAYLLVTIPFTIAYGYIYVMKYEVWTTLKFWIPRIVFSTLIWLGIYYGSYVFQMASLSGLLIYLLIDGRTELIKGKAMITRRFKK
ncbi:MAG: hypothetical protein EOO04_00560 [Chitinophagaceae bacterium]|nr:MAG: hypothetical protein EOO04_00560 [Chitinophagaceae bacterium]